MYYGICDKYRVNADETWVNRDWCYTINYDIYGGGEKALKRYLPENLIQWIITWSKGLTRKGTVKITRSVRAYIYLVVTSQLQERSVGSTNSH